MENNFLDYPAENADGSAYSRCSVCKVESLIIKGSLEGHLPSCLYRIQKNGEIIGNELRSLAVQAIGELNKYDITALVPPEDPFWGYYQQIQSKLSQ